MPYKLVPTTWGLEANRPPILPEDVGLYIATDTETLWAAHEGAWRQVGGKAERVTFIAPGLPVEWKQMPVERTEFLGLTHSRGGVYAASLRIARLSVNVVVVGSVGARLSCEYSYDNLTWSIFAPGSDVAIDAPGQVVGPYVSIAPGAKLPPFAYLRLVGYGGDGHTDPQFGRIALVLR